MPERVMRAPALLLEIQCVFLGSFPAKCSPFWKGIQRKFAATLSLNEQQEWSFSRFLPLVSYFFEAPSLNTIDIHRTFMLTSSSFGETPVPVCSCGAGALLVVRAL